MFLHNRITRLFRAVTLATSVAVSIVAMGQALKLPHDASASTGNGKQLLVTNCAACHGIDGKGSERAPNIADSPHIRQLSDLQMQRIIHNGVPGTGMPAFHLLSAAQVRDLIAYLRSVGTTGNNGKLPGDASRGEQVFDGKGGCSSCHMIAGHGGFIGPDLTDYARTHSVEEIRRAILDPAAKDRGQSRLTTVTVRSGEKYVGVVRNEDNFSLQIQSLDGTFHLMMKSDLAKVEYDSRPLMPNNFGSLLNERELNDLVSYLLRAMGPTDSNVVKRNEMDDLED